LVESTKVRGGTASACAFVDERSAPQALDRRNEGGERARMCAICARYLVSQAVGARTRNENASDELIERVGESHQVRRRCRVDLFGGSDSIIMVVSSSKL
jgi:hypothetical protein